MTPHPTDIRSPMAWLATRHSLLCSALVLLVPSLAAAKDAPPPAVVALVKQELELGGGRTHLAARLLQPLRLINAGAWLADFEPAGAADWCGSGGCRVMLFARRGKDWNAVFDRQVRQFRLDGAGLTVELYGKFCGRAGNAACMARYGWDAERQQWQPRGNAPPPIESI